jgi:hypothetical protein
MSFYLTLKTNDGMYLSATSMDSFITKSNDQGLNENMLLYFNNDFTLSFKTVWNTWICCWNDGSIRQSKAPTDYCKFIIDRVDDNMNICFKTWYNTYLSSGLENTVCHGSHVQKEEWFTCNFQPLMLRTFDNRFISLSDQGAMTTMSKPLETSKVTPLFTKRGRIALKTSHGKYMSAITGDRIGESDKLTDGEEFFVKVLPELHKTHGSFNVAFHTHNHMYITESDDGSLKQKKVDTPGERESFMASYHSY